MPTPLETVTSAVGVAHRRDVAVSAGGSSVTQLAQERSQGLFAGVLVPWRRVRLAQSWLAGVDVDERRLPASAGVQDGRATRSRGLGPEQFPRVRVLDQPRGRPLDGGELERVTPGLGADAKRVLARRGLARLRAGIRTTSRRRAARWRGVEHRRRRHDALVQPGGQRPLVRAVRDGAACGRPSPEGCRRTSASGPQCWSPTSTTLPLSRVERGIRTWPVFLRDIHGALFADVGSAGRAMDALPAAASPWAASSPRGSRLATAGTSASRLAPRGPRSVPPRPARPFRRLRAHRLRVLTSSPRRTSSPLASPSPLSPLPSPLSPVPCPLSPLPCP